MRLWAWLAGVLARRFRHAYAYRLEALREIEKVELK